MLWIDVLMDTMPQVEHMPCTRAEVGEYIRHLLPNPLRISMWMAKEKREAAEAELRS